VADPDDALVQYGRVVLSDDLLELQRLDTLSDQLAHRRAHLPERDAAGSAATALRAAEQRRHQLTQRDQELVAAIAGLEGESAELVTHRQRLEAQLKTVISPRAAEALLNEIETLTTRRDGLDDRELEFMEEQGTVSDEVQELERSRPDVQAAADETAAALAAVEAAVDAEAAATAEARVDVAGRLDTGTVTDYERRRQHFGGVGVARLEGKRCGGCHLDLSAHELDQVRVTPAGSWTDCPECGRMLVP